MIAPLETDMQGDPLEADRPSGVEIVIPGLEMDKALQSIREARDRVLAKNRELIDRLSKMEDQLAEVIFERDEAISGRDGSWAEISELSTRVHELETRLAEAENRPPADPTASAEIQAQLDEVVGALTNERDAAVRKLAEREAEIAQLKDALAQTTEEKSRIAALEAELATARTQAAEAQEAHAKFTAMQKKNVAGLAEQLAAAQRSRATALQERDAARKLTTSIRAEFEARIAALQASTPEPLPPGIAELTAPTADVETAAEVVGEALSGDEVHEAVTAMFGAVAAVKATPKDAVLLASLESRFNRFAESAALSDLPMMHTLGLAAGALVGRIMTSPARCESSLPTLEKAVEVLGWLTLRDQNQEIDTAGSLVFAVDDDVDNCECIAMELEKLAIQTKYTVTPEAALEQIEALSCDLIILDVDLPRLDGFAVHARIRQMPAHQHTPVIFLSGHVTTGERLAALHDSHALFVAKPYTLCELSLRILTLIVESRLG